MTTATDLLALITLICTTVLAVAAVLGGAYRYTVLPRLRRLERWGMAVEKHLIINGTEEREAHPDDRNTPMLALTLRIARRQREIIQDIQDHNAGGLAWRQAHETEHVRQDADWPVR